MRAKKEKTSKFARFFGAAPEKINEEYLTHVKDITYDETIKLISLFTNQNTNELDILIKEKGHMYYDN